MDKAENVSEYYYEKLNNSVSPGPILAALYGSLYGFTYTRAEIIMMNKLVKIFGRFTVFFSVLDMAGTYPERSDNQYPLLYKICKNKFERTHGGVFIPSHGSLKKFADDVIKERDSLIKSNKNKKKVPSSEGLRNLVETEEDSDRT